MSDNLQFFLLIHENCFPTRISCDLVYAMSKEYKESDIAGYQADGTPISEDTLSKRVLAASKRVKSGDFISEEEVEQEVQNWQE
ncbi:MAG: hypothetical protein ACERKD_02605 [Prolixibacteraceae bacterium]